MSDQNASTPTKRPPSAIDADSGEGGQRFRSIADSSPVIADSGSRIGSRR